MSSPKDYVLEITPKLDETKVESTNLIKFTVRNKKDDPAIKFRVPLLVTITSVTVGYMLSIIGSDFTKFENQLMHLKVHQLGIIGVHLLMILFLSLKQVPEDSFIIMKDIGLQSVSKKAWRFQNDVETFIPLSNIIDLVLHEGFHGYGQVIFYLCILTKSDSINKKNENVIKVVFPEFLPRKEILLQVWKLSRELLFGKTRRYWRRVPGKGLQQIN